MQTQQHIEKSAELRQHVGALPAIEQCRIQTTLDYLRAMMRAEPLFIVAFSLLGDEIAKSGLTVPVITD